jgi:hypothetical protein
LTLTEATQSPVRMRDTACAVSVQPSDARQTGPERKLAELSGRRADCSGDCMAYEGTSVNDALTSPLIILSQGMFAVVRSTQFTRIIEGRLGTRLETRPNASDTTLSHGFTSRGYRADW